MLNVTTPARIELLSKLMDTLESDPTPARDPEEMGFRIVSTEGQLGLTLDVSRPGDETVEHEGCSVLFVDSRTSSFLDGLTLDLVESENGLSLALL